MAGVERLTVNLPTGFDPARHSAALPKLVAKQHGDGFEVQNIDTRRGVAVMIRRSAMTSVSQSEDEPERFEVSLRAEDSQPTKGDKVAATLQATYDGFYMTRFEPFLGRATLTRLDDDTVRCRGAAANALGCKPWEVQVRPLPEGGFALDLPKTYVPSKHQEKLDEVATSIIGRPGWWAQIDARSLTATILPGELPTFPAVSLLDLDRIVAENDNERIPLGLALGKPGDVEPTPVFMDVAGDPHSILSGTTGSGKSVNITDIVTHQLLTGSELVIVDVPHKAVDYLWVKRFVRPGGWGCDSLEAAVTTLSMLYDEGLERAKVLAEHGAQNVRQLPAEIRPKPVLIVVDELSGLIQTDPTTGMAKGTPLRDETEYQNLLKLTILGKLKKIAAEHRFVGFRLLLCSQVMNSTTGVPPSLKTNLTNKILMGVGATRANRGFALADESRVPQIPEHIKADGQAGRGVGVVELAGQTPAVLKGFYVGLDDAAKAFEAVGLPTRANPSPSTADIARYTSAMTGDADDADDDGTPSGRPLDPKFGPVETYDADGNKLFGAAAAAAASAQLAATKDKPVTKATCPDCGDPIASDGGCGCDV